MPGVNRRSPRGFSYSGGEGSPSPLAVADPMVVHFADLTYGKTYSMTDWNFQKAVLRQAAHLFGNLEEWINTQIQSNPYVYNHAVEFLVDTVRFITTGRRLVNIRTMRELLMINPPPMAPTRVSQEYEQLGIKKGQLKNYLTQWVSHPDGFMDLYLTLNILFGKD